MQTLEKGISLSIRNDAAFIVAMNLEIYEHQTTYNPNMPLRSLIYSAEIIKKLVKNQDIFGRKKIKIPTPHFIVFYNGRENRPAVEILKLSDSFESDNDEPMLELICMVYNINPGINDELLAKCEVLFQYMKFIDKIREYECLGSEAPITEAMDWCIEHDILAEFLQARGREVTKAMTIDMTWERREQLIRRDERAEGKAEEKTLLIHSMFSNGLSVQKIAEICNLQPSEIEKILNG